MRYDTAGLLPHLQLFTQRVQLEEAANNQPPQPVTSPQPLPPQPQAPLPPQPQRCTGEAPEVMRQLAAAFDVAPGGCAPAGAAAAAAAGMSYVSLLQLGPDDAPAPVSGPPPSSQPAQQPCSPQQDGTVMQQAATQAGSLAARPRPPPHAVDVPIRAVDYMLGR